MKSWTPAEGIQRHAAALHPLSNDEFLARLRSVEPLPDADDLDPAWDDPNTFDRAELLVAFADEIGERRLIPAIAPLFERAALGDAYEMMQSIRHGPERAISPDWSVLTAIMRPLVTNERAGCRRWAVRELGILRDPLALNDVIGALDDPQDLVRAEACTSLSMLADVLGDEARSVVRAELVARSESDPSAEVRSAAASATGIGDDSK